MPPAESTIPQTSIFLDFLDSSHGPSERSTLQRGQFNSKCWQKNFYLEDTLAPVPMAFKRRKAQALPRKVTSKD